jgi:hypothetical protein
MSKPKVHTVYPTAEAGLSDVLDSATADEPTPTAHAAELVEEAIHAGPVLPGGAAGGSIAPGGIGAGELVDPVGPPPPTPRQSAENITELIFALVPAGDWQPENEAERDELVSAVEHVFAVRGWTLNLPPEAVLLAVMGKYTRRRMQKPAVRARVGPWLKKFPLVGRLVRTDDGESSDAPPPAGVFAGLPKMTAPVE